MCSTEKTCSSSLNRTTCQRTPPATAGGHLPVCHCELQGWGHWPPVEQPAPQPRVGPLPSIHSHALTHPATSFRLPAGIRGHSWMWTCEDPLRCCQQKLFPRASGDCGTTYQRGRREWVMLLLGVGPVVQGQSGTKHKRQTERQTGARARWKVLWDIHAARRLSMIINEERAPVIQ